MTWPFRRRDIGDYMHRWILTLPFGWQVRVHHIREADADPELHDHPFAFASLVLRGWYVEERPGDDRVAAPHGARTWTTRRAGSLAWRWASDAHRIAHVSPGGVWTAVLSVRLASTWGFYTADGWVDWRAFQTRKAGVIVNHGDPTLAAVLADTTPPPDRFEVAP